jgi:uncharacterized membrane protein YqjE
MRILASLARLGANFIALLHTRAELASVEIEEEALRYFSYLLLSLCALFALVLASLLAVLLVVVLFWDGYRIHALACLIVLFGGGGILLALKVRSLIQRKPRLLEQTMQELARDIESLTPQQ